MRIALFGASGRQGTRMLLPENGGDMLTPSDQIRGSYHAAVVATPTDTHYKLVRRLLEKGKHVLCEKPLAETRAEVDELVSLAERKGAQLMVCHTYLHDEHYRRCRALAGERCVFGVRVFGRDPVSWLPHVAAMYADNGFTDSDVCPFVFNTAESSRAVAEWHDISNMQLTWESNVLGEITPMRAQLDAFISGTWKEDLRAVYRMVDEMKRGKPVQVKAHKEMN